MRRTGDFTKDAIKKLEKLMISHHMDCNAEMLERFCVYGELLLEWNQKMNLTRITQPDEIIVKHFFDSLLFLNYVDVPMRARLIDVGTGAGFPGIPLLIARPDLELTLLDSLKKRLTFLNEVVCRLGLTASTLHARGEEAGQDGDYRESYEISTARAVAAMNVLSEYCIPFLKEGGVFAAMKGPGFQEECRDAERAVALLGGCIETMDSFELPDGSLRTIVKIRKMSQTPAKYPRNSAKIAKKPL